MRYVRAAKFKGCNHDSNHDCDRAKLGAVAVASVVVAFVVKPFPIFRRTGKLPVNVRIRGCNH